MNSVRLLLWLALVITSVLAHEAAAQSPPTSEQSSAQEAFFREQVEPILKKRCYGCHSHSAGEMSGNLALDWRSGWESGGDRGPAIVPNEPDKSLLIQAIRHSTTELRMPDEKMPDDEINTLVEWIAQGAFDDRSVIEPRARDTDWWSLRPLIRTTKDTSDHANWIDGFIADKLNAVGLINSPRADRRTLMRRVYYDLVGLPPMFEEIEAFVSDPDPNAYEHLVDRLLASDQYGERWARHWLDTIHFADSHGYEHDIGRDHAWRYRDYVIDALNQDKPWSQFIREQLAADFFYPEESSLTPALGFLGAGTFDLSTYSTATVTFDYLDRDDLVTQTMAAFCSTTANCARCHAHKFDPISQEDYYSLQAVFAGLIKGDVAFDADSSTLRERRRLKSLLDAAERGDAAVLLSEENQAIVDSYVQRWQSGLVASSTTVGFGSLWTPLEPTTFLSTDGATLTLTEPGRVLASGKSPDRDTYVITASSKLDRITALRLDVLPDPSLPMNGPGRCQNGNLHLSEVDVQVFEPGSREGKSVKLRSASADFDQAGWGIQRAIDGDVATAWGIHPAVGQPHYAVFEFDAPVAMTPESTITITLRQLHGGSHLIGAMTLSVTSSDAVTIHATPASIETILRRPLAEHSQADRLMLAQHVLRDHATRGLGKLPSQVFVYAAAPSVGIPAGDGQLQMKSLPGPKVVHVLHRGDFDKPREEVGPGALTAVTGLPARFQLRQAQSEAERRAALAEWIAHQDNGLTWRSIVNRVWHYHFGRGLCDTPSDFGRMGGVPSHPELIDALAVWFRDDAKGSLKALHRLIVTSDTYCQSAESNAAGRAVDADNRLLWRQNRQRLDADAVRDYVLVASGAMDWTMGGPAVQHFKQSKGPQSTPALDYSVYDWSSPGATRRSIYRYVWRGIADPFMESLDFPDLGLLSPTRGFSASSLQALTLYNNNFILHHSQRLAEAIESANVGSNEMETRVQQCVRKIWLRDPTSSECDACVVFAKKHGLAQLCRVLFNSNEFLFIE